MDYRLPDLYNERYTSLAIPSGCPTNGVHLNHTWKVPPNRSYSNPDHVDVRRGFLLFQPVP